MATRKNSFDLAAEELNEFYKKEGRYGKTFVQVINEFDPYDLAGMGVPEDEYLSYIKELLQLYYEGNALSSDVVFNVFSYSPVDDEVHRWTQEKAKNLSKILQKKLKELKNNLN